MVRKGNPKNIQAIDDVCSVRAAVAGLGTVEEAMLRGLSDKCVAGGKPPLEIVTCPPAPYSTAQRFHFDVSPSGPGARTSASPMPLCCLAILPHRRGEPGRELINLTFQAPNQGGDHACTE
jgi:hypothetical protein